MVPLQRLKTLLASTLACLFLVGLAGTALPKHEIYPFFSWFLFSEVPGKHLEYRLVIHELNGRTFTPPLELSRVNRSLARGKFLNAGRVIKAIGDSLESGNEADAKEQRALLEARYLPKNLEEYSIVIVETDPINEWHGHEPSIIRELARYHLGEGL